MRTQIYLALILALFLGGGSWLYWYSQQSRTIAELDPDVLPEEAEGWFIHSSFQSKTKGEVPYCAYLPPDWEANDTTTYPLLVYLYGQGGNEYSFARTVKAEQLNRWINSDLIEPLVIICVRGEELLPDQSWDKQKIQWYTSANEKLLLSEGDGELRAFCRNTFRAGMTTQQISLEGSSRGATGTLHYALKHSDKFNSFIANSFVSDYALGKLKGNARQNKSKLQEGLNLRMEIGTEDYFVHHYKRRGTFVLHDYLTELGIPHEYDTLSGSNHPYRHTWNFQKEGYENNGLFHLLYHQKARRSLHGEKLAINARKP